MKKMNKYINLWLSALMVFSNVNVLPVHGEDEANEDEIAEAEAENAEETEATESETAGEENSPADFSDEGSGSEEEEPQQAEDSAEDADDDTVYVVDSEEEVSDAEASEDEEDDEYLAEDASEEAEEEEEFVDNDPELDGFDFSSKRLLVMTDSASVFTEDMPVIADYDGLYLVQFETIKDAQEAYEYLLNRVDFVEPDIEFEADEEGDDEATPAEEIPAMTEEENPLNELSSEMESVPAVIEETKADDHQYVIALIDSGASVDGNVIAAVSMLGSSAEDDNGHGTKMVDYITEENPDAMILSIKALDEKGKGSASAIYAAMEYAIEQNVDVINLSLSAFSNADNAIIAEEIKKAVDADIIVVGSAGNRGMDAKYFIPGNVPDAAIATSATSDFDLNDNSNYGESVDYMVISNSGSEAAARLSGQISRSLMEFGYPTLGLDDSIRIYDMIMNPENYESDEYDGYLDSGDFTADADVIPFWEVSQGTANIFRYDEGVLSRNPNAKKYVYDYAGGVISQPKGINGQTVSSEWPYNATTNNSKIKSSSALLLWAPDAGMYFDEPFGMKIVIEGLDKGDSNWDYWLFHFKPSPAATVFPYFFVEGYKLYKIDVEYYHNVPAGSTQPAGDPLKLDAKGGFIYSGPMGLTHEGVVPSGNSMHIEESEFSSPIPADEPMYTYLDPTKTGSAKEVGIKRYGNSSGNPSSAYADIMMYYSVFNDHSSYTDMRYNSAFYQDLEGKTGFSFYVGITGTLDLGINARKVGNPDDFRYSDPTIWWGIQTISNWYTGPVTPYEIPDPEIVKYVYDRTNSEWNQDQLELFDGDVFDYKVEFSLPDQQLGSYYTALQVTDTFDGLLDLSAVTVDSFHIEDQEGNDVSNMFDITYDAASRTVKAVAKAEMLEYYPNGPSPFYNKIYNLIGTGFKKKLNSAMTADEITAFTGDGYNYRIPNKARIEYKKFIRNNTSTTIDENFRAKDSNNVYVHYDHWLKINYLEQGTDKVLYTQYVDPTRSYGLTYSVPSPDLKDGTLLICDNPNHYGYSLVDESQAVVAGTMPSDYHEINVYYYPHKLVINYLEQGTDVVLYRQYVDPSKTTNEEYSVKSPVIDGYALVDSEFATVSGTMNAPFKEHTVYYIKTPMIGDTVTVYKTANPASESVVARGSNITYTLTAVNTGAYKSNSYYVYDNIPEGTTYVSASEGAEYNASTGVVRFPTEQLEKGASKTYTITVRVNDDAESFIYNSAHWRFKKNDYQTNETIHRISGSSLPGPAALESVKGTTVETVRRYKILEGNTTSTTVYWYAGMQPFTWTAPLAGNYTYTITNGQSTSGTYTLAANQTVTIAGSGTPSATRIVLNNGGKAVIKLPLVSNTISQSYSSNGAVQTYTVPSSAVGNVPLTLEVWGSQGYVNTATSGSPAKNKGGYAKGTYTATAGQTLYVVVGHRGSGWDSPGYNGGGPSGGAGAAGGGATHIALETGTLSDLRAANKDNKVLIVGGGGGGVGTGWSSTLAWSKVPNDGAYGGGTNGGKVYDDGKRATQTGGYAKGRGENMTSSGQGQSSGGGGGWWGGYGDNPTKKSNNWATGWYSYGGGGSGYTGGVTGGSMTNNNREGSGAAKISGSYNSQGTQTAPATQYQDVTVQTAGAGELELGGVVESQTITYTISLSNNGGSNSIGTVLTDLIPTGTTFVNGSITSSSTGTITGGSNPTYNSSKKRVEWFVGNMEPNASVLLTFKVKANGDAHLVQNQANFARGAVAIGDIDTNNVVRHASNIVEHVVTGSIPITKKWVGDSENDRPASITIHLFSTDGTVNQTATLTAANGWQTAFTGLDTTKSYKFYEDVPAGYTSSVDGEANAINADRNRANQVTNTKIPTPKRTITVVKNWVGSADLPASVILHVKGSDGSHYQQTVSAANNWTYTFSDLPVKTAGGEDITYSVYETSEAGVRSSKFLYQYEGEENAVTVPGGSAAQEIVITNTAVDTINIPVKKVWLPESAAADYESVNVGLYDGSTLIKQTTLYKASNWTGQFTGIPTQTAGGTAIDMSGYTVREIGSYPGFTVSVSGQADATGFTVTNESNSTKDRKHFIIDKEWFADGEDNRPESIHIVIEGSDGSAYNIELTAPDWTYQGTLPAKTAGGEDITYVAYEAADVSRSLFKNSGKPGSYAEPGTYADGNFYIAAGGDGTGSLEQVIGAPAGETYAYRISDNTAGNRIIKQSGVPVTPGETYVYSGYAHNLTSGSVQMMTRVWNNGAELAAGQILKTLNDQSWTYFEKTFTVPTDGAATVDIDFGIREAGSIEYIGLSLAKADSSAYASSATAGSPIPLETYSKSYAYNEPVTVPDVDPAQYTTAITNTRKQDTLRVSKQWSNESDATLRPTSIAVHIKGSDGSEMTQTLTGTAAESEWVGEYSVPRYTNTGEVIDYVVWETAVDGYDTDSTAEENAVEAIYNASSRTYVAQLENILRRVTITKVWAEDAPADRPTSVTFYIKDADGNVSSKILTAPDWTDTFVASGRPDYAVWEEPIDGYNSSADNEDNAVYAHRDASGSAYAATITNTKYNNEKIKVVILTKSWINDEPADRPDSVTIRVIGSDGSNRTVELTAAEGWVKKFELPAFTGSGTEITYTAYEVPVDGYAASATAASPIPLTTITRDYTQTSTTYTREEGYELNKTGIANLPVSDFSFIKDRLKLANAEITIDGHSLPYNNFSIGTLKRSSTTYNNALLYKNSSMTTNATYVINESSGIGSPIKIRIPDSIRKYDGELYDLEVEIYTLRIKSSEAGGRTAMVMSNALSMSSFSSASSVSYHGTSMNVRFRVLDKSGNPADGTVRIVFRDIDQDALDSSFSPTYDESIRPLTGVKSALYVQPKYGNYLSIKKDGDYGPNTAVVTKGISTGLSGQPSDLLAGFGYIADASGWSLNWRGYNCATMLFNEVDQPIEPSEYTNNISNTLKIGTATPTVQKIVTGDNPVEKDWTFTMVPVSGTQGSTTLTADQLPMPMEAVEPAEPNGEPTITPYLAAKVESGGNIYYLDHYNYSELGDVNLEVRFYYTNLTPGQKYDISYTLPSGGYAGMLYHVTFTPDKPNGYVADERTHAALAHEADTYDCFVGGATLAEVTYDAVEDRDVIGDAIAEYVGSATPNPAALHVLSATGGANLTDVREFPENYGSVLVRKTSLTATVHHQGTASFDTITFKKPGTYVYEVTETSTNSGYENDSSKIRVTYTVVDNGGSTLTVTPSYVRIKADSTQEAADGISFTNRFIPAMMTITKTWSEDTAADRPASVTFHIKGSDGSVYAKVLTAPTWNTTFQVPADAGADTVTYKVWEDPIDDYECANISEATAVTATFNPADRTYTASIENSLVLDFPVSKKVFDDDNVDIDTDVVENGSTLHYVIYVTNPMSTAKKFDIEDAIPANSTYVADSANLGGVYDASAKKITWTGVEIAAGATKEIKFNVTAVGNNNTWVKIINSANVWMQNSSGSRIARTEKQTNEVWNEVPPILPGNDRVKHVYDVYGDDINGLYVEENDNLYYKVTVPNNSSIAREFTITDSVPENTQFVEVLDGGTHSNGVVTWVKTIPAGGTVNVRFTVKATSSSSDIVNIARVTVDSVTLNTNEVTNHTAKIVINKALSNYHASYGKPSFLYKIVGTDGSVNYRMIEITNQSDGTATFVVPRYTDEDVQYTVEELRNARYEFASVATTTADTTTVTANNPKGSVAFSEGHRNSVFNYTNTINDWMKASHADSVANHIGE